MPLLVSKEHGVNPSLSICFFCGGDKNEIILAGRCKEDRKAPHAAAWNYEPCDTCKDYMEKGVMVSVVKEGSDRDNPYRRTGQIHVIKDEAAAEIFNIDPEKTRFVYIEESIAKKVFANAPNNKEEEPSS